MEGTDTGAIDIVFAPCPGQTIESVALYELSGQVVGDDDDEVLWRIVGSGSNLVHIAVGDVPPGFNAETELHTLPSADSSLGVRIVAAGQESVVAFTRDALRVGEVYRGNGQYESEEEFSARERERCG